MTGSLQLKNKYLVKMLVICVFCHLTIRNISPKNMEIKYGQDR